MAGKKKASEPVMCVPCGVPMNRHAEKLVDPLTREEASKMDRALGGIVEEMYTCPECGHVHARRAHG